MSALQSPTALYVHVPFCRSRCAYCDFNTWTGLDALMPDYVAAVGREIAAAGERWGHLPVPTIYFGGGTPSLLPLNLLSGLLDVSRRTFRVSKKAEISLEANPGTITPAYLRGLRKIGINRLSLGVQSAHEEELRMLGRIHTWAQAADNVEAARAAGFDNLSLDFIFGLPGQTVSRWWETLEAALTLDPEHLSLYCLSVEAGTALEKRIASGKLPPPDDDVAAEMYETAEKVLAEAGFFHYEISNWTRANPQPHVCRHNLIYWHNKPWLGIGAGAHSWLDGRRWANLPHPREYIAALEEGHAPTAEEEIIDNRMEMGETMMLGLRLAEGVRAAEFETRFAIRLADVFGQELAELGELGLLTWDGHVARLTARGRLLGNRVFARFV